MIMHILFIMCIIFSSGHLQEFKSIQPNVGKQNQYLPSQIYTAQGTYNGGVGKIHLKPCARRLNSRPGEAAEQWVPTFSTRITKPFQNNNNAVLNSQSLKNDDFQTETNIEPKVTNNKDILANRRSDEYHDFRINEARNDLSVNEVSDEYDSEIDEKESVNEFSTNNNETEENNISSESGKDNAENEIEQKAIKHFVKCLFNQNEIPKAEASNKNSRRFMLVSDDKDNRNDYPLERNDYAFEPNATDVLNEGKIVKNLTPYYNSNQHLSKLNRKPESDPSNRNIVKQNYDNYEGITKPDVNGQRNVLKLEKLANQMMEPTKGIGISDISKTRASLLESPRVCYACSTASNPTCWAPDKRTTVKYCSKEHDACVTKTFRKESLVLIRDCGKSCDDIKLSGVEPKLKTCSICHSDLCNSAHTVISNNFYFVILFILSINYTI